MEEHLPPATPSTLVHGDLLGQNILLGLSKPDAVIDWEYAQLGDSTCAGATAPTSTKLPSSSLERSLNSAQLN